MTRVQVHPGETEKLTRSAVPPVAGSGEAARFIEPMNKVNKDFTSLQQRSIMLICN